MVIKNNRRAVALYFKHLDRGKTPTGSFGTHLVVRKVVNGAEMIGLRRPTYRSPKVEVVDAGSQ